MPELENTAAKIVRLESKEADLLHSLGSQNLSYEQKVHVRTMLDSLEIEMAHIREQNKNFLRNSHS
jgi:hypothetical protein